jgi:hypothetical protein
MKRFLHGLYAFTVVLSMVGIVFVIMTPSLLADAPKYQCWNGDVVKNPKKCPKIEFPIVCPDGSIVKEWSQCVDPPIDPVCPDGNCPPIDPPVVTE